MKPRLWAVAPLLLLATAPVCAAGQKDAPGIAFFESKIRPVLVQHCYRCHSEEAHKNKKLKAGLFLDSKAGLLKGGESGPALLPGKAKDSLLLKALHYDTLRMPPSGKLPDDVLADFARWIDLGAPDPRDGKAVAAKREIDIEEGRTYWAFKPLAQVQAPAVKNEAWVKNAIDRFILAKQESLGLAPSAQASREKLLRRAFFDLVGLPPTLEEMDAFLKDASPNAYEKMIDRLLASEHYCERWGRHWLDIVRFAESGGYEFDGDRPGAYHYRDFVIKALNQDMPYDQFIRWQLAGDKLAPGDYLAAAATGFLVAGPFPGQTTAKTIERIRYDQLDDMISTVGNGMLGLTLGCVRCHEHKYDPIPQQDYYRLVATLSRTVSANLQLDPNPEVYRQAKADFDKVHAPLVAARDKFEKEELPGRFEKWRAAELPRLAAAPWQVLDVDSAAGKATLVKQDDGSLLAQGKPAKGDVYTLQAHTYQQGVAALRLEALSDAGLPGKGPGLEKDGNFVLTAIQVTATPLLDTVKAKPINVKLKPGQVTFEQEKHPLAAALAGAKTTGWSVGGRTGQSHAATFALEGPTTFAGGTKYTITLKFEAGMGIGRLRVAFATSAQPPALDAPAALQNAREIQSLLAGDNGQLSGKNRSGILAWYRRFDDKARELDRAVQESLKKAPQPKLTAVFAAGQGGGDVFFLTRGEVERKAGKASPGFIQVLMKSQDDRWTAPSKSPVEPRVALANWITDAEQGAGHLLARVIVNRLWKHHFGRGLVATPNDFGAQGERPTHPELLDWLAQRLIDGGWKLKPIHHLIMTSAAYQQGSDVSPEKHKIDPENKYVWHRAPRRLEAEIIRDALLHVSGTLDPRMFGPGTLDENNPRRSVYLTIKRSKLIPFLAMFDAPEAIQSTGERLSTTVATQALAMMNSPFVRQRAEKFAQRLRPAKDEPLEQAIERAWRLALTRAPTAAERERILAYLNHQTASLGVTRDQALVEVCQLLLCLNEFVYVD